MPSNKKGARIDGFCDQAGDYVPVMGGKERITYLQLPGISFDDHSGQNYAKPRSRGLAERVCLECDGRGSWFGQRYESKFQSLDTGQNVAATMAADPCPVCNGLGWTWTLPRREEEDA